MSMSVVDSGRWSQILRYQHDPHDRRSAGVDHYFYGDHAA